MSTGNAAVRKTIELKINKMVLRIVRKFHPVKIILFGSYAIGLAEHDSDVDLLIVMPVKGSKRDLSIRIRLALRGLGISKDIVVVTPKEYDEYRSVIGTIVYPAAKYGKVLYEKVA